MVLLVGTSGWQYADWRGPFYPRGCPSREWLRFYLDQFATVEVNATFYRLPTRETVARWASEAPRDAVFTVKASRYLTHIRRLHDPAEPVARLLGVVEPLGSRLGPVLLQLPPHMAVSARDLDATLACFPSGMRVAVEPRDPSWFVDEVQDVLVRREAALVWADRLGRPTGPLWQTAGWGFVRLHQGSARPEPSYGRAALTSWVDRVSRVWDVGNADVFVYFNNDPHAAAVANARTFAGIASRRGLAATRVPAHPIPLAS